MRTIQLTEYTKSPDVPLSTTERDTLRSLVPSISITPTLGSDSRYDVLPGPHVGVVRIDDLQIEIAPRLPIDRVLFLVSYALDPRRWRTEDTLFAADDTFFEAVIPLFVHHVRRALRRGLLSGYRTFDDSVSTIRGRIRFADQIRKRPGIALPVEVSYDEFTVDILENQLLLAAVTRLLRGKIRNSQMRRSLAELRGSFETVTETRFRDGRVPTPQWTRLNERYRPAVGLAQLILSSHGVELTTGHVDAAAVTFDMTKVFENFVVVALREALGVSEWSFPQGAVRRKLYLDHERQIPLKPDLSWWIGNECVFVGDCKYKRASADGVPNADLYQLLAYTTALNLDGGLLVYAAGEYPAGVHTVYNAGKRLRVVTLDLAGGTPQVLSQVDGLAKLVRSLAQTNSQVA